MATKTWNPGEPVFDMMTGEPYIDENGALVEVAPNLKIDAPDGRRLDGDDVANAAWYRANKYEGETLKDRTIGVPYDRIVLGQPEAGLAIAAVVGEVRTRTPGIAQVVGVVATEFSPSDRVLRFLATFLKEDGGEVDAEITTS